MKSRIAFFGIVFSAICLFFAVRPAYSNADTAKNALIVYPPVPGLAPSEHYLVRLRVAQGRGLWISAFVFQTTCKSVPAGSDAYFPELAGWTHSYVNFEMTAPVEAEISRVDGQPIHTAAAHPARDARSCAVVNGKAYVILNEPHPVTVDIDGQMDDQDTGKTPTGKYTGPPIHTISLFANPVIPGKPKLGDPGVLAVKPGEMPPSDGPWTTLYFLPGVHDIGPAFPVHANRRYYIPGDAIVYGTFNNESWADGHNIRIFGLGTLSGARLKHPDHVVPPVTDHSLYDPIEITGSTDTSVEGITVADSAHHSIMLCAGYTPDHPTIIEWTKIITWRANGDGINPFGNALVENCFIRTQDDSIYVCGRGIRRTVFWNDANGSSFVLSGLPQLTDRTLVVEDCDVIYARATWHLWGGGRVFNMRAEGQGACGRNVIFRNILVEDPRPTLQTFFINMEWHPPYGDSDARGPGDLAGLLFQNIHITAPSILGQPEMLWGSKDAQIHDLTFDNLTVGGKKVLDSDFFTMNQYVSNLHFR
jgi:hypothetical protein